VGDGDLVVSPALGERPEGPVADLGPVHPGDDAGRPRGAVVAGHRHRPVGVAVADG
jgi:hypothetical protein